MYGRWCKPRRYAPDSSNPDQTHDGNESYERLDGHERLLTGEGRNVNGENGRPFFKDSSVAPVRLRENLKQLGQFPIETTGFVTLLTWTRAARSSGALILRAC